MEPRSFHAFATNHEAFTDETAFIFSCIRKTPASEILERKTGEAEA